MFTRSRRPRSNSLDTRRGDFSEQVQNVIDLSNRAHPPDHSNVDTPSRPNTDVVRNVRLIQPFSQSVDRDSHTPLNVDSMCDNTGFSVTDEISSDLTGNIPPTSGAQSRASSYLSLSEVDLLSIQQKLDKLESEFPDLSGIPRTVLDELHDKLINLQGELDNYAEHHQGEDSNLIEILSSNLNKFMKSVDCHRFGVTAKSSINLVPTEGNLQIDYEKITSELNKCLRDNLSSIESRIVSETVKQVCDEYNRVQIRCTQFKNEIKRSVSGIRGDLNQIFGDLKSKNKSISELSASLEACKSENASNVSATNTNFDNVNHRLSQLESNIASILSTVNDLQKSPNHNLERSSVQPNLTSHGLLSKDQPSSKHSPPDTSNSRNTPLLPTVGDATIVASCLPTNVGEGTNVLEARNPSIEHLDNSDSRSVGSSPVDFKLARVNRKVNLCITLADKITAKDLSSCTKSKTIELCTYDLKQLESLKSEIKSYESQLLNLPEFDESTLDKIEETIERMVLWESALDELRRKHYLHLSKERSLLKNLELKKFSWDPDGDTIYHSMSDRF